MRYYGRRRPKTKARESNSFWLSFSDLMSMLLLMFILVMFYSIYQYLGKADEAAVKENRAVELAAQLLIQQNETNTQKQALDEKDKELEASQGELTEKQKQLLMKEAELLIAQADYEKSQAELDAIRAQLDAQGLELTTQRELLASQQDEMALQQKQLEEMVGVRARIVNSLAKAFNDANLRVKVDKATGSIAFEESVLFDFGSSELKESGQAMLDKFLPVYLSVIMDGENGDNIGEIIIEGHTDRTGSYMANLDLSQKRALAVMQYMLADEYSKITPKMKERLRNLATPSGRSYMSPILDSKGNIDDGASRRVEFKFRMKDEQAVQRMNDLLEKWKQQDD